MRRALNTEHSFNKLAAGRTRYAIVGQVMPAQFDKAINRLVDTGAVVQILSNYR